MSLNFDELKAAVCTATPEHDCPENCLLIKDCLKSANRYGEQVRKRFNAAINCVDNSRSEK